MAMEVRYVYKGKIKYFCSTCHKSMGITENGSFETWIKTVEIEPDGYYHYYGRPCWECEKKAIKRKLKLIGIIVLVIAAVVAILLGIGFGNELLTGGLSKSAYEKVLKNCETNPKLATVESANVGADTLATLMADLADGDYVMTVEGDGKVEVQRNTLNGKTTYYWVFNKGYGDLSGKTFVLEDDVLYDLNGKLAYHNTAKEYAPLLDSLKAYWPENYCGKGSYNSEKRLKDDEQKIYASLIYGDGVTCLYYIKQGDDKLTTRYYEKSDKAFVQLNLYEPEGSKAIAGTSTLKDCKQVK